MTTSNVEVGVTFDTSGSNYIGLDASHAFTVTGPASAPTASSIPYQLRLSSLISARNNSKAPLLVSFEPGSDIPQATGTITVTFETGEFAASGTMACMFIDSTGLELAASSCSYSADVVTVTAPALTDITTGNTWSLKLTTVESSASGLAYPTNGYSAIVVDLPSEQFEFNY